MFAVRSEFSLLNTGVFGVPPWVTSWVTSNDPLDWSTVAMKPLVLRRLLRPDRDTASVPVVRTAPRSALGPLVSQ